MRRQTIFLAALLLTACSSDDPGSPSGTATDLGPASDGSVASDQGVGDLGSRDGGGDPTDQGPAGRDQGPVGQDQGPAGQDQGLPPADLATPDLGPADGGAPDLGPSADLGQGCEPACPAGERRCASPTAVQRCQDDATGCAQWGEEEPCAAGEACTAGLCQPRCEAADTRCLDPLNLQICEAGQIRREVCTFGCDAGAGRCYPCPEGAWRCLAEEGGGFRLESCRAGDQWQTQALCEACSCAAGDPVQMDCHSGPGLVATDCAQCSDDGLICLP